MKLPIRCAATLLLLLIAGRSSAGTPSVAGRVVDDATGQPVRGARVEVANTALVTTTDGEGRFALEDLPIGLRLVRAVAEGYAPVSLEVPSSTEPVIHVELRLRRPVHFSETVVVTAHRQEANDFDVPRSVAVVTSADLARTLPRTTPEALMDLPGVLVQKTNHGGGSPYIRGLVGNQVLVLVDGIRLNNSTFRYGPNQYLATVDPGQIERIEVVRGAGSSLFGSDAMGGVINIITKRPALSTGGLVMGGTTSTKFVSSGMERTGRLELTASGGRAALIGGLSLRDYGDLHAGGDLGVEAPSAYTELNGDAKALVRISPRHLVTFGLQHVYQDDVPRFDQVAQRGFSRYSFDPQIRRLGYAQWQAFPERQWMQAVTATVSLQQSLERRERQRAGSPIRIVEQDDVRVLGASLELRTAPGRRWLMVSGIDYTRDWIRSWRRDTDAGSGDTQARRGLYPDGASASSAAAFTHGSLRLGATTIDGGLRFSQYSVFADDPLFGTLEMAPRAWVGTLAVMQDLADGVKAFGSLSQAFRAPNIDDLGTLGAFDFGIEVPSPGLAPERSLALEAGVKLRRGAAGGSLAAYRMNLSDLIDRVRATFSGSELFENQRVYRRANVGKAYVFGVEGEGEWHATPGLTVKGHLAYTYGQQTSTDQPMRRIPPLNGLIAVRLSTGSRAWLEGSARFATKQDRLASGDRDDHRIPPGGTPGWIVVSASSGVPLWGHVDLVGGLQNIFNEAYRVHGSGIDGYGRAAWIGAHVRF